MIHYAPHQHSVLLMAEPTSEPFCGHWLFAQQSMPVSALVIWPHIVDRTVAAVGGLMAKGRLKLVRPQDVAVKGQVAAIVKEVLVDGWGYTVTQVAQREWKDANARQRG